MSRPRILLTLDTAEVHRRGVPFDAYQLKAAYVRAVERAGGVPLLVAPGDDVEVVSELGDLMDGLIVTGGDFDIDPEMYGEQRPGVRLDAPKPVRTQFERLLIERALERGRPVLGICAGMQLLNVLLGGTLHQDIGTDVEGAHEHEQPSSPATPYHPIQLTDGCPLARAIGADVIQVNSTHHQAVAQLGKDLVAFGVSDDGLVEAIRHDRRPEIVGVQWHPELLDDPVAPALYGDLVRYAGR